MFQLLLGYLVGDYLLQNEFIALNKSKNNLTGWITAIVHCLLYTFAVCLIMWNFDWYWILIVFSSHFPIDKFGLAEKYMHYIKGKGLKDFINKNNWIVDIETASKPIKVHTRYDILEGGFTAFIYAVTDNTLHLLIMYIAYNVIY